jgi:hypothetical protein
MKNRKLYFKSTSVRWFLHHNMGFVYARYVHRKFRQ